MAQSLSIRQFDPASIKPFRKHLFIGGSGRGKTQCMLSILNHIATMGIDCSILMCPTETTRDFFHKRKLTPPSLMYSALDIDVIANALAIQRENKQRGKSRTLLLCLDDCAFDNATWRHPVIRELLFNQRHLGIHTLITVQYVMVLPPDCRTNIDYVYTTSDSCFANVKRLHSCFFGCFRKVDDFHRVHSATTTEFSLCVADCTESNVTSPADMVFYYRAPARIPRFTLGREVFWKLDHKRLLTHIANEENRPPAIVVPTDKKTSKQRPLLDAI